MDYTLVAYDVSMWEGKAYSYGLQYLREAGCPVDGLKFDPDLVQPPGAFTALPLLPPCLSMG